MLYNMMWNYWLKRSIPSHAYSKFQHFEFVEVTKARKQVAPTLANAIYRYHSKTRNDEQTILRELRFWRTALVLQGDQRPHDVRTRRGNFAEILACEFAREMLGYEIPVYRLHFNPNIEQSMKGDDILGFKFKGDVDSAYGVIVGEAKYRSSFDSSAVQEAYDALNRGNRPYPMSMDFTATVLRHEGNGRKAEQVEQIKKLLSTGASAMSVASLIVLVTEGRPKDPFGYIEGLPGDVDELTTVSICLGVLLAFFPNSWYS